MAWRFCPICLVHTRPDAPPDNLAVLLPILAILAPALLLVAHLAVDQEDGEVQHVEVGNGDRIALDAFLRDKAGAGVEDGRCELVACGKGGKAVGPRHQPVSEVVDVAGSSPPAGSQQAGAGGCLDVLQVSHLGVIGVGAEAVLLVVSAAEDVVAKTLDAENGEYVGGTKDDRVDAEVACLDGV